ncbi:MAG TPA: class I SAM-dependent methyltransferase [Thermoanaerobaculia bacterium]|jgi:cyclopropane-fatty-acyl-phospholipid synthase
MSEIAFSVVLHNQATRTFGSGRQVARIVANNARGTRALATMDMNAMGEAYLAGDIDVEGDLEQLLSFRGQFRDSTGFVKIWRFLRPLIYGQAASDKKWIADHYDEDPDFFRLFLDPRHRCYSQGVFASDDEPLEDAMTRKMDFAIQAAGIEPGMRVLDIGGGWGAFFEYGGKKGIQVTSLTISKNSEAFLRELGAREQLPSRVVREHLYEHKAEPYDAIVNMGVTEHLPDYAGTLKHYERLLKPGGAVYLDASASRKRYDLSTFFVRRIFPGNGTTLCLQDYVTAVAQSPFELEGVWNDRHNYELTTRAWARNLDANGEEIERRWGKALYRTFRLYLWGCADGFSRDMITAYRWVLRLRG